VTSSDGPGERFDAPGPRTDPGLPPVGSASPLTAPVARPDGAAWATEAPSRVEQPGSLGVLPGWTDRSGSLELPVRSVDGATTATDPRGARLDPNSGRTDPTGVRGTDPAGARSSDLAGSLAPTPAARTAAPAVKAHRRARLTVRHVDPWSVLKFTFLFSLCMLIIGIVAVAALYYALDRLQVFDEINKFVKSLTVTPAQDGAAETGGLEVYFQPNRIIGGAAIVGALNAIIITALATLGAFLYNLVSDIVGGIEVVLAERD